MAPSILGSKYRCCRRCRCYPNLTILREPSIRGNCLSARRLAWPGVRLAHILPTCGVDLCCPACVLYIPCLVTTALPSLGYLN